MPISVGDFRYNPVNLGNIAQPFSAGFEAGRNPQLSQAITQLFNTGISEAGAMARTQVSERGAMQRSKLAAGYPEAAGIQLPDWKTIQEHVEKLPGTATVKFKLPGGIEVTRQGTKTDPEEQNLKLASAFYKQMYPFGSSLPVEQQLELLGNIYDYIAARRAGTKPTAKGPEKPTVGAEKSPGLMQRFLQALTPAAQAATTAVAGPVAGTAMRAATGGQRKGRTINIPGVGNVTIEE